MINVTKQHMMMLFVTERGAKNVRDVICAPLRDTYINANDMLMLLGGASVQTWR